jgi:hypothetical protein
MKYDIPVIFSVEAKDIDEARQTAYSACEHLQGEDYDVNMADDSQTTRDHKRIVFLHPEDISSDNYDQEAYNAKLKDADHDQE